MNITARPGLAFYITGMDPPDRGSGTVNRNISVDLFLGAHLNVCMRFAFAAPWMILSAQPAFPQYLWDHVSDEAKDFIKVEWRAGAGEGAESLVVGHASQRVGSGGGLRGAR